MTQDAYVALLQMVKKTQMFSRVPKSEIGKRSELWEFDSGVPMITQGQRGEAFFMLYEVKPRCTGGVFSVHRF